MGILCVTACVSRLCVWASHLKLDSPSLVKRHFFSSVSLPVHYPAEPPSVCPPARANGPVVWQTNSPAASCARSSLITIHFRSLRRNGESGCYIVLQRIGVCVYVCVFVCVCARACFCIVFCLVWLFVHFCVCPSISGLFPLLTMEINMLNYKSKQDRWRPIENMYREHWYWEHLSHRSHHGSWKERKKKERFWNLPMKYSSLLCGGEEEEGARRSRHFFFFPRAWILHNQHCIFTAGRTKKKQRHRAQSCRSKHRCKVRPSLCRCRPAIASARVWFVTAGREVFHQSPGKFSSDEGGEGGQEGLAWYQFSEWPSGVQAVVSEQSRSQRSWDWATNTLLQESVLQSKTKKLRMTVKVKGGQICWKDSFSVPFLWSRTFSFFSHRAADFLCLWKYWLLNVFLFVFEVNWRLTFFVGQIE